MKKIKKYFLPASPLVLALLALAFVLLAHRPRRYAPLKVTDQNLLSPYLTHHILPKVYNGSQLGEPFEIEITEQGLNDIAARWPLPLQLDSVTIADPQVILQPRRLIIMATIEANPIDLFATIDLTPTLEPGSSAMNLHVNEIRLGAVDVTTIALSIGSKEYSKWLTSTGNDPNDAVAKVCRSLLNDEPFEPRFEMYDKTLRISGLILTDGKLTVSLTPVAGSKTE